MFNQLNEEIHSDNDNIGLPNNVARRISKFDFQSFHNYGCFCNFDFDEKHYGSPVDEYDHTCKLLVDGYECIGVDNEICDIDNNDYISAAGFGNIYGGADALVAECEINDTPCKVHLCKVESYFTYKMLSLMMIEMVFPDFTEFTAPNFDKEVMCIRKINGNDGAEASDKDCCGNYPFRFPYKTKGGDRGCCGSKTFDAVNLMCCEDGKPSISC